MKQVLVYGLGNFGYAILKHLDRHRSTHYLISAYDRNEEIMTRLRQYRSHSRINPEHRISEGVKLPESLADVFYETDILVLAVTAASVPQVAKSFNLLQRKSKKKLLIINTAKALDSRTGDRLESVIKRILQIPYEYAYLAGGTIADDLYNSHPLGATLASKSRTALKSAENLFASPNLRLYLTNDVAGTEYCGAFKNVISIFAGIISGLGWPYGSETYFISRFAAEIERFVTKELEGEAKTFRIDSQCWGNDLWMSCTGPTRNREFGVLVGRGLSIKQARSAMDSFHKTVEGLKTIAILPKLKISLKEYPFLKAMKKIISDNAKPGPTIKKLIETRIV